MRKKRRMIALMVIVVLAAVIVCVKSVKNSSKQTLTVTDPDGITYLAVLDQDNNVYAGVTDASGTLYGARIGEDGYPVLDDSLYVVGEYTGTLPKNNTTAVNINQSSDGTTYNYNAGVSVIDQDTTKENENTTGSGGEQKTYMTDKYKKLFASGTYSMKFSSNDPNMPDEILMAFKNGSLYVETSVEGTPAEVIYNADTKTGMMILRKFRVYCTLPEDMVSDLSSGTLDISGDEDYKKVKVYKVDINGRECTCESFTYSDGQVKNYYFYNEELVRMDFIEADSSSTVYNIISISSDVPDSYFETPKGYLKLNIAKLLEQYGDEEQ